MVNFSSWPSVLVVDTEGNGTQPPDLVEVAAVPIRDGQPDPSAAGAWLICPPRPVTPRAARVHGLTNQVLARQPLWGDVADQVHERLAGVWICAHHAHVDYRVLRAHLPSWEPAGVIDTLRLARATFKNLSSYTLDALLQHVQPDLEAAPAVGRHRAAYDAFATAQLLIAMSGAYATWEQLVAAAVPPGLPGALEPEPDLTLW